MYIVRLIRGEESGYNIYGLASDGRKCDFRSYADSLNDYDKRQVFERITRLSRHGDPHNTGQFRKIKNSEEIFEIKTKNVRIFCFKSEAETKSYNKFTPLLKKSIILLHAKMKNEVVKKKIFNRNVAKAEKWREEFFTGEVEII